MPAKPDGNGRAQAALPLCVDPGSFDVTSPDKLKTRGCRPGAWPDTCPEPKDATENALRCSPKGLYVPNNGPQMFRRSTRNYVDRANLNAYYPVPRGQGYFLNDQKITFKNNSTCRRMMVQGDVAVQTYTFIDDQPDDGSKTFYYANAEAALDPASQDPSPARDQWPLKEKREYWQQPGDAQINRTSELNMHVSFYVAPGATATLTIGRAGLVHEFSAGPAPQNPQINNVLIEYNLIGLLEPEDKNWPGTCNDVPDGGWHTGSPAYSWKPFSPPEP